MATDTTLIPRRSSSSNPNRAVSSRQTHTWGRLLPVSGPRRPREGPSFFDSASNVGIYGGRFAAHHAPQASVTVNITHGAAGDENSHDNRDEIQVNSNPESSVQNQPHVSRLNSNQRHESQLRPVQRSNVLYEQHLLHKGRGHPLWIPQPNLRLPISYRKKGVSIGDVGIITPDGAFDFLFNICLGAEDPIHSEELPENFTPLNPPLSRTDIREFREFTHGSYLASSSVISIQSGRQEVRALAFESSASEGAILTMPEGAYMQELNNIPKFRDYLSVNAESWYKFINGPCGREAKNGDLRLVVGCDKSTFWGMAVFSNLSQQTNFRLEFNGRVDEQGQLRSGNAYDWHHSGTAEVRVGPDAEENEELTVPGEPATHTLRNQCLFVRTLNVTLSDAVWEGMFPQSMVEEPLKASSSSSSINMSKLPRFSTASKGKHKSISSPLPNNVGKDVERRPQDLTLPATNQSLEVIITSSPSVLFTVNPAKLLSDSLFEKFPEAKMTIIHDSSWYSPLQMLPLTYDPAGLIARVGEINDPRLSNGIAYLEPIEDLTLNSPEVAQFSRLIDGHISVKDYLFGTEDIPEVILDCISRLTERFYVDDVPLKYHINPDGPQLFSFDFADTLESILHEMLNGNLRIVYREEDGQHRIPSELPGHPHFFLPLSRIRVIAAKSRQSEKFDPVADVILSERIESLRFQLNQLLFDPPSYTNSKEPPDIELLQRLAGALYRRYIAFRDKENLDEAISYYQEILKSTQYTTCPHLEGLLGLCASLYQRLILQGMFQDFVDLVKGLRAENILDLTSLLNPIIDHLRTPSEKAPFPSLFKDSTSTDFIEPKWKLKELLMSKKYEDVASVPDYQDNSQQSPGGISDNTYYELTPNRRISDTEDLDSISFQTASEHQVSVLRRLVQRIAFPRRRRSPSRTLIVPFGTGRTSSPTQSLIVPFTG